MILNYVKIEVRTNTAEVSWVEIENDAEGNPLREVQVRCHTYSAAEASTFAAEIENAARYMTALGWA